MGRQRLTLLAVALAVLAALFGLSQYLQGYFAAQVYAEWMNTTCTAGEKGELQKRLRRYGSRLEPRLEEAFLRGPSEIEKARWQQTAKRDWQRMAAAIDAGKTYGLNPQEILRLRSQGEESFVKTTLEDYTEGYRSAAIAGLGIISTEPALQFLRRVGGDVQHRTYWDTTHLALERAARTGPPARQSSPPRDR